MTEPAAIDPIFERLKAGLDVRAAGRIVAAVEHPFRTGFSAFDGALGGGIPRGTLATLEGPPSSGRTALLAAAVAQATRTSLAAIIDDGTLFPPDLERAGADLDRVLVVQARKPVHIARAADILLRARAFSVIALPAVPLRGVLWSRLCALAQKSGTVVIALGLNATTELAYFASTRVRCAIERVQWTHYGSVLNDLQGYDLRVHVLKHRRAAPGAVAVLGPSSQREAV